MGVIEVASLVGIADTMVALRDRLKAGMTDDVSGELEADQPRNQPYFIKDMVHQ